MSQPKILQYKNVDISVWWRMIQTKQQQKISWNSDVKIYPWNNNNAMALVGTYSR